MHEKLSALMDGELSELETRRILAAVEQDPVLRATWERYHLVRAAMQNDLSMAAEPGFSQRLGARLDEVALPRRRMGSGALRWAGTAALAASVATVAIVGARFLDPGVSAPAPSASLAVMPATNPVAAPMQTAQSGRLRWSAAEPDVERQLNAYLVEHNEFAPSAGVGGMLPYVRVVGYDSQR